MGQSADDTAATKTEWTVTQTALDKLLAWLDPDRDRAAAKYEHVRRVLIKTFITRGYAEADVLADKTIDRVAKLNFERDLADEYTGTPMAYFLRVARYIRQEHDRPKLDPRQVPRYASSEEVEHRHACLEECLQRLVSEDRDLVLHYYRDDKRAKINNRRELAEQLGISAGALRLKAHRLRVSLQECMEDCLGCKDGR